MVLEDENIFTRRKEYSDQRKEILAKISNQEIEISKARKYFLEEKIEMEDFVKLKSNYKSVLNQLNNQLNDVTTGLIDCDLNNNQWPFIELNVLRSYKAQDTRGKREIINLFTPSSINPNTRELDPLRIDAALSLIIDYHRSEAYTDTYQE